MSSFGKIFKITTFGESHGIGVGCIVENVPPMLKLSNEDIQYQLNRRKPNQNSLLSTRAEPDIVEIYSGVQGGVTLGTPICLIVKNVDIKPSDYKKFSNIPRPGHADLTYLSKYGVKSSSGGGRASARETVARVAGGSIAEKYLKLNFSTDIVSFVNSIGTIEIPKEDLKKIILDKKINKQEVDILSSYCLYKNDEGDINGIILINKFLNRAFYFTDSIFIDDNLDQIIETNDDKIIEIETNKENLIISEDEIFLTINNKLNEKECKYSYMESINIRCPHPETAVRMIRKIMKIKSECDSIGGTVSCVIRNCPRSLGEPCFDKFEAELAKAMLSIPATKGFEIGSGFEGTKMKGSEHNDVFIPSSDNSKALKKDKLSLEKINLKLNSNFSGGTLGGITTGEDVYFRVAIKPVSTISKEQITCDLDGNKSSLKATGRHDPCVLPRAMPIIESMAALVLMDFVLLQASRINSSPCDENDSGIEI